MMVPERFTWIGRIKSFRYALQGLGFMLRSQQNAQVHLAVTVIVLAAGAFFKISASDWRWLTVAIAFVWVSEAVNTAFEYLCDVVSPQHNESVAKAKDIAAGAVLIAAVFAVVVGGMIFLPHLAF